MPSRAACASVKTPSCLSCDSCFGDISKLLHEILHFERKMLYSMSPQNETPVNGRSLSRHPADCAAGDTLIVKLILGMTKSGESVSKL